MEINKNYNEDCIDTMSKMPDNFIDMTITSPPYNLMGQYSNKSQMKQTFSEDKLNNWYNDSMDETEYQEWQKQCLREMVRVTSGVVVYVHQVRYAWGRKNRWYHPVHWLNEFVVWAEIIWDRGAGISGAKRPTLVDQRVYVIGKPKHWTKIGYTNVWKIPPDKNNSHVSPFPEELAKRCMLMYSIENQIIYDPFMGSGTTAKVAILNNRRWIGSEISKEYCNIISERI